MPWNPVANGIENAGDVAMSNPADGDVLAYDSLTDKWRNEPAGSGGSELQSATVVVRPVIGNNANITATCREHGVISTNSTDATVIQAAIDHVSNFAGSTGHTGGKVLLGAYRYQINAPIMGRPSSWGQNPTIWPVVIEGEGGLNAGNAGANSSASGGTVLVWTGGSSPTNGGRTGAIAGAVLNLSEDCHGYKVKEIVIEGNGVANYAGLSAGRGIEWHGVRLRNFVQRGLFVTNGDDDTLTDPYVQTRIYHCRAENSSGVGFYISNSRAGKGCTDGRIRDLQANNCAGGSINLSAGGWAVNGGHITMSTSTAPNMIVGSGFTHITNMYFDTCGNNAGLSIENNSVTVSNCFFLMDGKTTSAGIEAGSRAGVSIMNCLWNDTSSSGQYFFRGTSSGQVVIGCVGPTATLTGGILAPGFSGYQAGNIAHA